MNITYLFHFSAEKTGEYILQLDEKTMEIKKKENDYLAPPWALLEFNQCPNCPLESDVHLYCPAAKNIAWLIEQSNELQSYDEIRIEAITAERTVMSTTTMQRGMCSLLGLMIAGSGCPYTHFLKPMARFHLPFANEEETVYRAVSAHFLMLYFRDTERKEGELDLEKLTTLYKNMQVVNAGMARRIRDASNSDATINAIILLDLFAKAIPDSIEDSLSEIKHLFSSCL